MPANFVENRAFEPIPDHWYVTGTWTADEAVIDDNGEEIPPPYLGSITDDEALGSA